MLQKVWYSDNIKKILILKIYFCWKPFPPKKSPKVSKKLEQEPLPSKCSRKQSYSVSWKKINPHQSTNTTKHQHQSTDTTIHQHQSTNTTIYQSSDHPPPLFSACCNIKRRISLGPVFHYNWLEMFDSVRCLEKSNLP